MAVTLGAETVAWSLGAHWLDGRSRHRLARAMQFMDLGIEGAAVEHNRQRLRRR
jgi:hypothetical protein